MFLDDNSLMAEQREREITNIVKSIAELHEIFKDLGQIIADQVSKWKISYFIGH